MTSEEFRLVQIMVGVVFSIVQTEIVLLFLYIHRAEIRAWFRRNFRV